MSERRKQFIIAFAVFLTASFLALAAVINNP